MERRIAERTRKGEAAIKQLDDLRAKLTEEKWTMLDNDEIVRAVRLVQASGLTKTYGALRDLERSMKVAQQRLSKALDAVTGKQLDMMDAEE